MKRDQGQRTGWAQAIAISVIYLGALYASLYFLSRWTDRPTYLTPLVVATAAPFGAFLGARLRRMRRTPPTQTGAVPPPITSGQ
jgi:hypothetical protein